MESVSLAVSKRDPSVKARDVRLGGMIPAECYGVGRDNVSIQMNYQDFRRAYKTAGNTTILDLKVGADLSVPVLVKDMQYDPISDEISHVDFIAVQMDKVLNARIPLEFVGVSLAIKDLGGVLVANLHELEVKCLPKDLVHSIKVDISPLVTFAETIHVKDLVVPTGLTVVSDAKLMVVTVSPPNEETAEDLAPAAQEAAAAAAAEAAGAPAAAAGAEGAAPAKGGKEEKKDDKKK
ncbi:MAG: 50S ribosomal protein L25 [Candidatus Gracilibacteria bacterium]